ncbi:MAG: DUF1343 domain-containing protein [Candidatus Fermentibacteraceae bacterium]|nr:DUF1343 domain-containing protein [Candidatus Fermentibacteraceae bacterium]MBN2608776.1 DUF1343 domain-containing protein [Candidatus Fermentibacteraceae bacterium]
MRTGLERLNPARLPGKGVGLLSHYAAVDSSFRSSLDVLAGTPGIELRLLLGPQHGFYGETQDNMIEWEGYRHPEYGIPVHSLYGRKREPDPDLFRDLDCLVVDLQDVGSRYYTYVYTMAYCMRVCHASGIPVMVLDRPNPLGLSVIEGRPLEKGFESFVGLYPIPARHGLTIGELARLFADLDSLSRPMVMEIEGWNGLELPQDYPWVYPSPNMPSPEAALVYPGMCLLEGTNISEGRGTTRPFTVFGAPWLDGYSLCRRLNGSPWLRGAVLRPHAFIPTFSKHSGLLCGGCELHVTDRDAFRALRAGLGILLGLFEYSPTRWKDPPYEYEYSRLPIDILSGGAGIREAVESRDEDALMELAAGDPEAHAALVRDALLYERAFIS